MIGGRIQVRVDNRPEGKIRRSIWRLWMISFILLSLALWHSEVSGIMVSILIASSGIPLGWLFGYRLGFVPFFLGVYLFGNNNHRGEAASSP
jgi:hypothetical protein